MNKKVLFGLSVFFFFTGCATQHCESEQRNAAVVSGNEKVSSSNKDLTQRVFVYKPDGSLQCGQGSKIDINTMKKELKDIEVFSVVTKHDGMMRIQVCGQPTGQNNVFEIHKKDLEKALKLGFKSWIRE